MKNLKFNIAILIALIFSATIFVSCQDGGVLGLEEKEVILNEKQNAISQGLNDETVINQLLSEMKPKLELKAKAKKNSDFTITIFTFEVAKNLKTGEITLENLEGKNVAFLPLDDADVELLGHYTVNCDLGNDSWSANCSGGLACGKLVKKCMDAGGCARVCEKSLGETPFSSVKMTYYPNYK